MLTPLSSFFANSHLIMKLVDHNDHKGNAHKFVSLHSCFSFFVLFLQKAIVVKFEITLKNIYPVPAFSEVSTYSILYCLFCKVWEVIHLYRNSSTSAEHLPGNVSVTGLQSSNSDTKHCKYLKEWHRKVIYFKLFFVKVWLTPTRSVPVVQWVQWVWRAFRQISSVINVRQEQENILKWGTQSFCFYFKES